jgi:hypothetical protein
MLISFHYARTLDLEAKLSAFASMPRIFGDSGAFSAVTLGARISVDEYAAWLSRWKHLLAVYANLDEIGDAEGTWRNQKRLEAMGHSPLPVYHTGEPWEYFDRYCREYPYLALGGAVGYPTSKLMPWAIECFRRCRRLGTGTVFHGFGLTNLPAIMDLPWHSCDSSSWGGAYRFGRLQLWDPAARRMASLDIRDRAGMLRNIALLRQYADDAAPFLDAARYRPVHAVTVAARSWRAMETYLRRRHGPVPRPDGADLPGLHLYLADGCQGFNRHHDANRALSPDPPGPHLYLADFDINWHRSANLALKAPT